MYLTAQNNLLNWAEIHSKSEGKHLTILETIAKLLNTYLPNERASSSGTAGAKPVEIELAMASVKSCHAALRMNANNILGNIQLNWIYGTLRLYHDRLRVMSLEGLRVIDRSVMPAITSENSIKLSIAMVSET